MSKRCDIVLNELMCTNCLEQFLAHHISKKKKKKASSNQYDLGSLHKAFQYWRKLGVIRIWAGILNTSFRNQRKGGWGLSAVTGDPQLHLSPEGTWQPLSHWESHRTARQLRRHPPCADIGFLLLFSERTGKTKQRNQQSLPSPEFHPAGECVSGPLCYGLRVDHYQATTQNPDKMLSKS